MSTEFEFLDYLIFAAYATLILGVGLYMSRDKKGHQKNAEDYFLVDMITTARLVNHGKEEWVIFQHNLRQSNL